MRTRPLVRPSPAQAKAAAGAHASVCAILDTLMGKPPSLEVAEPAALDGVNIRFLRRV